MIEADSFSKNVMIVEKLDTYAGPRVFAPAHETDAGIDLCVAQADNAKDSGASISIAPGERKLVPTGVKIVLPFMTEGQIRTKSGRALKDGLVVLNSPGTVDPGYRGELKVILYNAGQEDVILQPGDKIAQLVLAEFRRPHIDYGPVSGYDTTRGEGGFGSTGIR